jgi:hypothetical protein
MAIQGVIHGLRSRGSFNAEIKWEGEWVRFNDLVNSLNFKLSTAAIYGQKKWAEKYASKVRTHIRTGGRRFGYKEHSDKYAAFKAYHGGPGKLLVWSGSMANAVDIKKLGKGRYAVGIPTSAKRASYPGEKGRILPIHEYANILEQGSWPMPARPVFSDTFIKDLGGMKGMKRFIELMILRKLRLQGVPIRKMR